MISIHAPRVGSDEQTYSDNWWRKLFQSTLPVWGATLPLSHSFPSAENFNPRSPCGERLLENPTTNPAAKFQSTLPVWGATPPLVRPPVFQPISIHAPRVGSDGVEWMESIGESDFNPRSPCGERPVWALMLPSLSNFNPRSPCGERHYLETGSYRATGNFNPRSPCGERLETTFQAAASALFQSTLPVWGATHVLQCGVVDPGISIHAPRVGSDPTPSSSPTTTSYFNPRSPCGERLIGGNR